jgi:mannose-6-phosphate isomerase-like protein (cupin superfamily)
MKGEIEMSATGLQEFTYVAPETGESLWILGDQVTFKVDGERQGLTFFVSTIPVGGGPPPHIHHKQEEAHYVLEGTFSFLNGHEWVEAVTGSVVCIPRGVLHTFRNLGPGTGRLISTSNYPGSHERWFRHVGVPITDSSTFRPPETPPDMEDVLASAAREDIHIMVEAPSSQGHL